MTEEELQQPDGNETEATDQPQAVETIEEEPKLTKKQRRTQQKQEKKAAQAKAVRQRKFKRIATWMITIAAIGAVFVWLASEIGPGSAPGLGGGVGGDDWVKGNPDAKVTLVEYSDFECPACASFYPIVKQLSEEFKDDLRVVYRHFPLPQHRLAIPAARAAEAAGQQGKFWEMHDLLFENQRLWSGSTSNPEAIFSGYAQQLDLDVDQFKTDFNSSEVAEAVNAHNADAVRNRVNATPTFFLNGQRIQANGYAQLKSLVEQAK